MLVISVHSNLNSARFVEAHAVDAFEKFWFEVECLERLDRVEGRVDVGTLDFDVVVVLYQAWKRNISWYNIKTSLVATYFFLNLFA